MIININEYKDQKCSIKEVIAQKRMEVLRSNQPTSTRREIICNKLYSQDSVTLYLESLTMTSRVLLSQRSFISKLSDCRTEVYDLYKRGTILLRQRSNRKWLKEEDNANTNYFYKCTNMRKKMNMIHSMSQGDILIQGDRANIYTHHKVSFHCSDSSLALGF